MNNPLANFDLSLFLENLPNTLQRPMTVAVGASILTHGLVLVGLPLLTAATDAPEKPDRVVNVITLTPEEQAKLPQAAPAPMPGMIGMPGMGMLPGIAALPGMGPLPSGSPTSPSTGSMPMPMLPSLNPSNNPLLGFDFPNNSYTTPTDSYNYNPFPSVSQPVIKDEKKEEKKTDDKKTDDKKTDDTKPEDKKTELPDLTPGVPGTTGPIAAANPNGAAALKNTQPASLPLTPDQLAALKEARDKNAAIARQQQEILVATTYNPDMTTLEAGRSQSLTVFRQLAENSAALGLTEDAQKALWNNQVKGPEISIQIPQTQYKFDQVKPATVQVMLDPNNKIIRSPKAIIGSGYGYIDQLAEKAIGEQLNNQGKTEKPSGKYQTINFPIKFVIPPAPAPVS